MHDQYYMDLKLMETSRKEVNMKLNPRMQPVDSIPATDNNFMTALDFDSRFDKGAITNNQLQDQNVTADKLSNDAITGDILSDGAVTTIKLASEAVTTGKIAGSAVTTVKINPLAVTDAQINDYNFSKGVGTITAAAFNNGTLTTPVISGTAIYPLQAGSAALSTNGQFLFQTNAGGSAILTVRAGGTTFVFTSSGTI